MENIKQYVKYFEVKFPLRCDIYVHVTSAEQTSALYVCVIFIIF